MESGSPGGPRATRGRAPLKERILRELSKLGDEATLDAIRDIGMRLDATPRQMDHHLEAEGFVPIYRKKKDIAVPAAVAAVMEGDETR